MKVSELWLRTFINPPLSAPELAEQLTNSGLEVDSLDFDVATQQNIFTLKIPPNRSDCLSTEGLARELALLNAMPYQAIIVPPITPSHSETFPIRVEAPALCPRYRSCIIKNINNTAVTPDWLKERLTSSGIRSLSPVVDILNYVMLELGQPMHAFDLAKLKSELVIRKSIAGERITLLDDREIVLDADTLVIADTSTVQALAGIMGGLHSSVTDNTSAVLIECAYFDPIAIRLAGSRYGIKTDGAYRFERGVDPLLQERALARALQLLIDITDGSCGPIFEQKSDATLPKQPTIFLKTDQISRLLGLSFPANEVVSILNQGGFQVTIEKDGFTVRVPSFRQDISIPVDLIEEIARVHGLHRLPSANLTGALDYAAGGVGKIPAERLKSLLVDRGYYEAITYSFGDLKTSELFESASEPLVLKNPISAEMAAMRLSLLPGLVEAVATNQRRQAMRARFFEMGVCFLNVEGKTIEKPMLSGIISGSKYPEQWGAATQPQDFFDIKMDVEALLALMGRDVILFESAEHPALHPGQTARILRTGKPIGFVGTLHPRIIKALSLEGSISVFELEMKGLVGSELSAFIPLSKFPAIRRDIALLVDKSLCVAELKASIEKSTGEFLRSVSLFDVYEGKGIPVDKKSVALGLILQHPSRTLVEGEGNDIVTAVVASLQKQFNAILRN
jgi:phenylalanyl-tRNA synthetase beta chain